VYEHARARIAGSAREIRRAMVMGAGGAARLLLAGIHQQGWVVLGLLDDDPAKQGARIGRRAGAGAAGRGARPACAARATHVIVACLGHARAAPARAGPGRRHRPAGADRAHARTNCAKAAPVERLRDIEPEDLLGREPVQLDEAGIGARCSGKVVLITGAGGSIGSELCRQVARYRPARLVLYELSEFNLYTIEQELTEQLPRS
jgi:FlaA1/EpsC-like NDP-sugar epimerase